MVGSISPALWAITRPYKARECIAAVKQCCAVQFSAVQFSSVQFSSVQCSAVQCSSVQCSSVQFSSVQFTSRGEKPMLVSLETPPSEAATLQPAPR